MEFKIEVPKKIDYYLSILIVGKREETNLFVERLIKNDIVIHNLNCSLDFGITLCKRKYIKFKNKIFKICFTFSDCKKHLGKKLIGYNDAIFFFYSSFDRNSFENVEKIFPKQESNELDYICVLIRNNYELCLKSEDDNYVSDEEAMEYAEKNSMLFAHISSFEKYDSGIKNLLNLILIEYLRRNNKNN